MINIYSIGTNFFVWNPKDVMELRKHRIVGALTGIYPNKSFQVQTKWLPLQLMKEEVFLLIEKGLAKLFLSPGRITDPDKIDLYLKHREQSCEEQVLLLKENRKKTIIEKADEIYEGKKRKYMENKAKKNEKVAKLSSEVSSVNKNNTTLAEDKETESEIASETDVVDSNNRAEIDNKDVIICDEVENSEKEDLDDALQNPDDSTSRLSNSCEENAFEDMEKEFPDKETIISDELAKVTEVSRDLCMVQLFTECPWKNMCTAEIRQPSNEMEKLRCAVFKDLWEKEYFITSGLKFGGDFLAYEGDPLKYHASFIVICVPQSTKLLAIDILTYGRLGHQVKKTVALASTDSSEKVEYISVTWAHDV